MHFGGPSAAPLGAADEGGGRGGKGEKGGGGESRSSASVIVAVGTLLMIMGL